MSKTVLYNWNVWKVQIRSQRLAQVCEICLHGSNLALQHASQINSVMCNSSISFYYYFFLILHDFCLFVTIKQFPGDTRAQVCACMTTRIVCGYTERPESIKGGHKIFFPIYSTAYTLLQSSRISQSLPEDTIWRLAPAKKKMQGLC